MGNEQQSGTSHHFLMNTSNDRSKQPERESSLYTKHEGMSVTKQVPITPTRSSWQIARDMSMDSLSSKAPRLSLKQGTLSDLTSPRSIPEKHLLHRRSVAPRSFQFQQTPRMPTEKEAAEISISYDFLCSFCEGPLVGDYIRCRVCTKTSHCECLFQHGYISDQSFHFPRLAKQDWTCPECNDLTRLLNEDEVHHLIDAFEQIDRDKDGYIVLEEFLSLRPNERMSDGLELFIQYNHHLGKRLFSLMDSSKKGVVTWTDFALFYSCKLIAVKEKSELITKLTDKELVMARKLFFKDPRKTFDNEYNIIITRGYFNRVYKDLHQLLKKKYGIQFLDAILHDDHHVHQKSQELSVMNWSEFLHELSLFILLNRSNDNDIICSSSRRASIPPHLAKASVVSPSIITSSAVKSPSRMTFSRLNTPVTNISCDESFRKHAKILRKLNRSEELKRKQINSLVNFTIVENLEEEENINLPKLKANARDDRKAIIDPWTSVKEIEQLRNQPTLIKSTRLKILQT